MTKKGRIREHKRDGDNDSRLSYTKSLSRRQVCEKGGKRAKRRGHSQLRPSTSPRAANASVPGTVDGTYTHLRSSGKTHNRGRSSNPNPNSPSEDLSPEDGHGEVRDVDDGTSVDHGHGNGVRPEKEGWHSEWKHNSKDQFDKPLVNREDAEAKKYGEESHVDCGHGYVRKPESSSRDRKEVVDPIYITPAAKSDDKLRAESLLTRFSQAPCSTKDVVQWHSNEPSLGAGELHFVSRNPKGPKHRNLINPRKSAQTAWYRLPRLSSLQSDHTVYKPGDNVFVYTRPEVVKNGNQVGVARINAIRNLGGSRFAASILWYYTAKQAEEIGVSSDMTFSYLLHVIKLAGNYRVDAVIEKVREKQLMI